MIPALAAAHVALAFGLYAAVYVCRAARFAVLLRGPSSLPHLVSVAGRHNLLNLVLQRLAERRYLTRVRATDDRRVEYLSLTPAGERVYADLKSIAADYDAALIDGMSQKEAATLRALLQRLAVRT